jgi:tripartite-type tricarboxylate transporter receptor subunit TctC
LLSKVDVAVAAVSAAYAASILVHSGLAHPEKPVRIVMAIAAGGSIDLIVEPIGSTPQQTLAHIRNEVLKWATG